MDISIGQFALLSVLSGAVAYGFLTIEFAFRRRRFQKTGPKPDTVQEARVSRKAAVTNAAVKVECDCPEHLGTGRVRDYVELSDGRRFCSVCDSRGFN